MHCGHVLLNAEYQGYLEILQKIGHFHHLHYLLRIKYTGWSVRMVYVLRYGGVPFTDILNGWHD